MSASASATSIDVGAQEKPNLLAFVQDDDSRRVIEQVIAETELPGALTYLGDINDAIRELGSRRSPNVLVVDIACSDLPLSAIADLSEVCEPGVSVIAIGERNDVGLFRDLINHGLNDYLVKPINPELFQRSLSALNESEGSARRTSRLGRLIVIAGMRGGVGATLIATNIAWSIAHKRRRRVALIDLDLHFGTAALGLDLEPSYAFREALENSERIDGLFLDRAMIRASDTLHILAGEESLTDPINIDYSAINRILQDLRRKFHYVVVDLPRQISPATLEILSLATSCVIVTDISLPGIRETIRFSSCLSSLSKLSQIIVCVNRVGEGARFNIEKAEFEKAINRAIDVFVPYDPRRVNNAINNGQPLMPEQSKIGQALTELEERVCGVKQGKRSRFNFLRIRGAK